MKDHLFSHLYQTLKQFIEKIKKEFLRIRNLFVSSDYFFYLNIINFIKNLIKIIFLFGTTINFSLERRNKVIITILLMIEDHNTKNFHFCFLLMRNSFNINLNNESWRLSFKFNKSNLKYKISLGIGTTDWSSDFIKFINSRSWNWDIKKTRRFILFIYWCSI